MGPRSTTHLALHLEALNDRPDAAVTWLGLTLFDPADPTATHTLGIAVKPTGMPPSDAKEDRDEVSEDFALDMIECFLETAASDWGLPVDKLTVWSSFKGIPAMAQLQSMAIRQNRDMPMQGWEEHNVFTLVNVGMVGAGDFDVYDVASLETGAAIIAGALT